MNKFFLVLATFFISTQVFAGNLQSSMGNALSKNLENKSQSTQQSTIFIYGGQDISRRIAVANESVWNGQRNLTG